MYKIFENNFKIKNFMLFINSVKGALLSNRLFKQNVSCPPLTER